MTPEERFQLYNQIRVENFLRLEIVVCKNLTLKEESLLEE